MAYDLNQFIANCSDILARDPGPAGREQVRVNLERLLANKDFVEEYCGDAVPRGLKVLYEDPKLGFQILAHINDKARVSPPHDHGASWAIYGQATKYTDMIEWERETTGQTPSTPSSSQSRSTGSRPAKQASTRTAPSTRLTILTTHVSSG
jgi:predicted metal-dependent enzyme (double-stranded beta helix superfamily)